MVDTYDVVLATYNGELYLEEQLRSIENQSLSPAHVYIADDGSTDYTKIIISKWTKSTTIPTTYLPPLKHRLGSIRNFERLLSISKSNYVMLSDQDDLWHSDKAINLISSIRILESHYGSNIPLLAFSDLQVVDSSGHVISSSFFRYQHLNPFNSDWNLIGLQNIVPGCSCVVNRKCIQLSLPFPDEVVMHDWWLALVASFSGKTIYYQRSTINYRQHINNVVGAKPFTALISQRLSLFVNHSLIDKYIGEPILQLKACSNRFRFNHAQSYDFIRDLTSINPVARVSAALKLRLKKHGIMRTSLFYIFLIFWKPKQKHRA